MVFVLSIKEKILMFIRPVENIVPYIAENSNKMKFISACEIMPKVSSPIEVVVDKFIANEKALTEAPKTVIDSITRIFW